MDIDGYFILDIFGANIFAVNTMAKMDGDVCDPSTHRPGPAPGLCDFPEGSAKCCVQELPPPTVRAPGF